MKRALYFMLILIMVFTLCSCGRDLPATVADENAAVATIPDETAGDVSEPEEVPVIDLMLGQWYGYETFSWEQVSGLTITVVDVTSTDVVFHYHSPSVSASNITVTPDADGNATVTLDNDVTLDIHFSPNEIHVDEIQGMCAMSYAFK